MDKTVGLGLPYIMPAQAQKHVTHNEALRRLDALVQLAVRGAGAGAPPPDPEPGERHLVADPASGAWAGHADELTAYEDGAWAFYAPRPGWLAWVEDEARLAVFDGAQWAPAALTHVNPVALLGVNATADSANPLTVKGPGALFDHQGDDHRLTINKSTPGDTASVLFQTGYSGRAEFGLTGDDAWRVKISADGASWVEALRADADGTVRLSAGLEPAHPDQAVARRHIRARLAADRTYHVRTDGDDGNDGLADSAGGAFRTIARALAACETLEPGPFSITIQLGDGTYDEHVRLAGACAGAGAIVLAGNPGSPQNTVLTRSTGTTAVVELTDGARLELRDLEIAQSGTADLALVSARAGARARLAGTGLRLGAAGPAHLHAAEGGTIAIEAGYTLVGNAERHWQAGSGGTISAQGAAIAVAGRSFAESFAHASGCGVIAAGGCAFSGSASGKRYEAALNGVIDTGGAGATFLPGDVAGTTATGGQYG